MTSIDWRWRHGPASGPLHGAIALTAASIVGTLPVVDAPPDAVLGGGAVVAGVVAWRSRYDGSSRVRLTYRLVTVSGGSTWLAHAVDAGWSPTVAWTLAAGAVGAGLLWRPVRAMDRRRVERAAVREAELEAAAVDVAEQERLHTVADTWVWRIERVAHVKGCRVLAIQDWVFPGPDGVDRCTGYTVEVQLPATGETWRTIAAYADGLASAADLPEGCGIEVGPGASKRRCLVEVATHDALRDDMPYLPAQMPGDIDAIPFGVHRDGSLAVAPMRFESTLLTGAKRSGKTNELLAILGRILECNNTVVCVIDYNGGAVALPWLMPWASGEISDSPILWVADTPEEATLMCAWLVEVIEFRKKHYHAANTARDDDKIDASPVVPQIILVTDEFGSLDRKITEQIRQVNDRGGGAAVTTLTCSLGSTSTYVPPELLAQVSNRLAMRVNDEKALGYLFEWAGGKGRPKPEDAPHTGYGHYRIASGQPKVFKGPRILPSTVRQVAVTTSAWRPRLDEATARMSPDWARIFEDRWERSAHLVAAAGGRPGAGPAGGPDPERPPRPEPESERPAAESFGGAMDRLGAAAEKLRDAVNGAGGGPGRDTDAEFQRIVEGFDVVPELVVRALVAFRAADRMHSRDMADALGVRVELLGQLLSQLDVRPLPSDFKVDGRRGRGYRRADLEAAADRIRRGDLVAPESVAGWRPDAPELPPEWT
ncbi:hypothetical protein GCM10022254_09510 [Actinomadura meridiana]|uniref:FtsK domain-containing protein n=1 Tax=Actinomadura meridiana TaxID=559626 RepID=A0ABP8BU63_9ACTN